MATPAPKKQKTSHGHPQAEVVKFSSPVQAPDVRLKVLGLKEFHVHSFLLKHHSAFFRKFLDSPDKQNTSNTTGDISTVVDIAAGKSARFRYEWATKMDDDGKGWHLVCDLGDLGSGPDLEKDRDHFEGQAQIFENLLRATYSRPYYLDEVDELLALTEMADYYCMLPILSASLDAVLPKCTGGFCYEIPDRAVELFPIAVKLRNELLFRECLIFLLGPFDNPSFWKLEDPKLTTVAQRVFTQLKARVADAQRDLWQRAVSVTNNSTPEEKLKILTEAALEASRGSTGTFCFPLYFRIVSKKRLNGRLVFRYWIDTVASDLQLVTEEKTGKGEFERYFLCDCMNMEDLPWDPEQVEW